MNPYLPFIQPQFQQLQQLQSLPAALPMIQPKPHKRWGDDERTKCLALAAQGKDKYEIHKEMPHRTPESIQAVLNRNGFKIRDKKKEASEKPKKAAQEELDNGKIVGTRSM
jgi:hypothetical protein